MRKQNNLRTRATVTCQQNFYFQQKFTSMTQVYASSAIIRTMLLTYKDTLLIN